MGIPASPPSASTGTVVLSVDGAAVEVQAHVAPSTRLIDVLRQAGRTGVKLGCGEGGCGACAVRVAQLDAATGAVQTRTINACLAPVASLDGAAITTALGLGNSCTGFSPVQDAIARHHASQCGFCTPGIVVACHAVLDRARAAGRAPTPADFASGLDGNLCRCTGWRPILDACKDLTDLEDLAGSCKAAASRSSTTSSGGGPVPGPPSPPPREAAPLLPPWLLERAQAKAAAAAAAAATAAAAAGEAFGGVPAVVGGRPAQVWLRPRSLPELWEALRHVPAGQPARLVAGNTGAGVYKNWPVEGWVVDLKGIAELNSLTRSDQGVTFGGAVTLAQLGQELRRPDLPPHSREPWAAIALHVDRIAGHHVRSAATLGGHFALLKARPLESDVATVLLAAGAQLHVTDHPHGRPRWIPLDEWLADSFGNGGGDAGAGEVLAPSPLPSSGLVLSVFLPYAAPGTLFWSNRLALRYANSHALVNIAVKLVFDREGATFDRRRVGGGGADDRVGGGGERPAVARAWEGEPVVAVRVVAGRPRRVAGDAAPETWACGRLPGAEAALVGRGMSIQTLLAALEGLTADLAAQQLPPSSYPSQALEGLLFQGLTPLLGPVPDLAAGPNEQLARLLRGVRPAGSPPVTQARQVWQPPSRARAPVYQPVEKDAVRLQASGEALYTGDIGVAGERLLHAAVVTSSEALAVLEGVDPSPALALPGVVAWVGPEDIPPGGVNETFGSPLFATDKVRYIGQPLGLIVAESATLAERAARLVRVDYSPSATPPIITIDQAIQAGAFYDVVERLARLTRSVRGDAAAAMAAAQFTIKDATYDLPSQQHMYMEPQTALAQPGEGGLTVYSATQSLDAVQSAVAEVLGLPYSHVTVVAKRLGGAFGGKASRCMPVAAAAALAARKVHAPVAHALNRNEDFRLNGGRCLGRVRYSVGFAANGRITALEAQVVLRAGAFLDLAFADGAQLTSGTDNAYAFENVDIDVRLARCNLPPHTIMRGPGYIQGVMVMEQVLEHVAAHLGLDSADVKAANFIGPSEAAHLLRSRPCAGSPAQVARLLSDPPPPERSSSCPATSVAPTAGDAGSAGTPAAASLVPPRSKERGSYTLPRVWEQLLGGCDYRARVAEVAAFNARHVWRKRGIVCTPVKFDCSPANVSAAISIYADGTVLVTHGGIEMGQGLSTKVAQAAAYQLGQALPEGERPLPLELIRLAPSSSDVVPNGGPTWSSTGSEGCVQAVRQAATQLVHRLLPHIQARGDARATWAAAVKAVHSGVGFEPAKVMLSAYGFYGGTHSDGSPVRYSAYGAACSEVELDALTGERRVLRADIVHDCGRSLNPGIDIGQIEGAFVQGLGMWVCEHVVVDEDSGRLVTDGTWGYKIPTPDLIPRQFNVRFLEDAPNPGGIMSSKASGEPALMTSTSVLSALQQAAAAAAAEVAALSSRPAGGVGGAAAGELGGRCSERFLTLTAPATPQRIKATVGPVSVAGALRSALGPAAGAAPGAAAAGGLASAPVEEEWVLVNSIAGAKLLQ